MERTEDRYALFKRSIRSGAILSGAYALIASAIYIASFYWTFVIDYSYAIAAVLTAGYAIPIVRLIPLRHWYIPPFVILLWVPLYLLLSFAAEFVMQPPGSELGGGLAIVFFFILNLASVVCGIGIGLIVKLIMFAYRKIQASNV